MEKTSEAIFWGAFNDELEKMGTKYSAMSIKLPETVLKLLRTGSDEALRGATKGLDLAAKVKGAARKRAAMKGFKGLNIEDIIKQRIQ